MSTPLRALLLCAILGIAASASGQINIVNFDFGAVPVGCSIGYAYQGAELACSERGYATQDFDQTPGFGWIIGGAAARHLAPTSLEGGAGVTGPNTIFYPPPFDGFPFTQAVFLQDIGSFVWQELGNFSTGTYTLNFYLGSRFIDCCGYDGNQTVVALIDGTPIGTWALSSYTPFTLETASFTVTTGGNHTLAFMGTNPGDHTAFLSYVTIAPTDR
ncbi:MAG TPA: hypothetical protein VMD98_11230 [Bryocella sp.]|nr:hypothetical protein [Bryocella sp.]